MKCIASVCTKLQGIERKIPIQEDINLLQMQIKLKDMIAKSFMTVTVKGTHSDNAFIVRKKKRFIATMTL